MTTPMLCARCGAEILPGSQVEFVGTDDAELEERRIFVSDELIVAHTECPKDDDKR